jgi:pyridoxal phosphate enzyme (YggS family)
MSQPPPASRIAVNLARVQDQLAAAAARAGRAPADIRLIAVSKTQPPAAVAAAVAAGQRVFGENTVQDAMTKIPGFAGQGLEWHFIGHLQSNKARQIPGHFAWWHSLDSLRLAERVARFAQEQNAIVDTLIEVNITRDPAKHGVLPEDVASLLERLLKTGLAGVRLRGLMAIGPHPAQESELRAAFAEVRALGERCRRDFALPDFRELSMGMSGDYVEAILEGASMIRIGTAIFGARNYATR